MGAYDTTIGVLLLGIFFNTFLYGLVCYQFAAYHRRKFNDRPMIKYMVLFLFILDTVHTAGAIYMAWYYAVKNYDNPQALTAAVWPYQFTPVGTALAALVTQLFLGFRIWRLTGSRILYGVVISLAIPSFLLGTACSIGAWIIRVLSEIPRITPIVIAWLVMQVVVDTFVTVTLIIVFTRSKTGYRKTDTVLNRLIRGAIQTGLFAGIFSLGDLISFLVAPNANFYGMFAIPIGRIYTNTLMDTLLSRESIKAEMLGTYTAGGMSWAPTNSTQPSSTLQSTAIQLDVRKTTVTTQETCASTSDGSFCEDLKGKSASLVV